MPDQTSGRSDQVSGYIRMFVSYMSHIQFFIGGGGREMSKEATVLHSGKL